MGRRREQASGKAVAASVGWIIVLLGFYWLIAEWHIVPQIIASAIAELVA